MQLNTVNMRIHDVFLRISLINISVTKLGFSCANAVFL